jgi:hypothetical protein
LLQLPTACQLQNASLSFCPSEYLLPLSLTHLFYALCGGGGGVWF